MIRRANLSDFNEFLRLAYDWYVEDGGDMGWPAPEPAALANLLATSIADPSKILLVSDCGDGKLNGMLLGLIQPLFWAPQTLQAVLLLLRTVDGHAIDGLVNEFHRIVEQYRVLEVSFTVSSGYRDDKLVKYMHRFGYESIGTDLRKKVCTSTNTAAT